jgi:hypothetical protein
MIAKTFLILVITSLISGCSTLSGFFFEKEKPIEIVAKPVQIEIIQPALPREIKLEAPKWYVVSEAKVANLCKSIPKLDDQGAVILDDNGEPQTSRPKVCSQDDRENPNWPEGYTYFDKFIDDIKTINGGDVLFIATSIKDYELMAANIQELRRYIRELGEVIIYYREVTTKKPIEEERKK